MNKGLYVTLMAILLAVTCVFIPAMLYVLWTVSLPLVATWVVISLKSCITVLCMFPIVLGVLTLKSIIKDK